MAEVGGEEPQQDPVLEPGLFIAVTNIRLRSEPDISSKPTGKVVKQGEVFRVTEVALPSGPGTLGYLRVGERGWVFDRGVSGKWVDKPIVDNVPEGDVEVYSNILSDPSSYAAYRSIMDDPDHVSKIQSLLNEKSLKGELEQALGGDTEKLKQMESIWKELESKPAGSPVQEAGAGAPAADPTAAPRQVTDIGDVMEMLAQKDPEYKALLEKVRVQVKSTNPKRPNEPITQVSPRWMKLAGVTWEELERDEDGNLIRRTFKEPPRGELSLRHKPSCNGWRMGMRVPSVCSAM